MAALGSNQLLGMGRAAALLLPVAAVMLSAMTTASAMGPRPAGDRMVSVTDSRAHAVMPFRPNVVESLPDERLAEAQRYEHGEGVEQNYEKARELYCALAFEGDAAAAHRLAWMYLNGRGVEPNDDQAATWLNLAAEKGHEPSKNLLKALGSAKRDAQSDCPQDKWLMESAEELERLAPEKVRELAHLWAAEVDLDPYLVLAVIAVESNFKARAVSHKSARGLMQLIPATAARFGVKDVFDPSENVRGGTQYLRWLLDHFDGDVKLALAGYNAGENKVLAYSGVPPYRETIGYIRKIRDLYAHPHLEEVPPLPKRAPASPDPVKLTLLGSDYLASE